MLHWYFITTDTNSVALVFVYSAIDAMYEALKSCCYLRIFIEDLIDRSVYN